MGPKVIERARPYGVCRAGPSLAAHILGYTGKDSSMMENWRKKPLLAPFQLGVMPVPAGFLWVQK